MCLENKIAFVTGGGGGIGKAICLALAKEKATVVLFGGNNLEKLLSCAESIKDAGGKCLVFPGNLTDMEKLKDLFGQAIAKTGGIDILINNAGMAINMPFEQTDIDTYQKIMDINVKVPYFLSQLALPYLKVSSRASIINIASVVSHAGYPNQSAYTASKHALLGFTKSLATEVFDKNIRVHAISPGGVYTDMVKISRPDLTPEGMIMPEDIAEIVTFLLKSRSNAVIDEILVHRTNKQPFLI